MLFALLITALLANGALAGTLDSGTKSVLTVPGLLRAPVLAGGKLVQREYSSVQGQQVVQVEPNVVLHQEGPQRSLPVVGGQQGYYGAQQPLPQQPLPHQQLPHLAQQLPQQQQPGHYGPLPAAVQSRRYVQIVPYLNTVSQVQPQIIEVDAITAPVQFLFRSASGPLLFQQVHVPQQPQQVQHTRSEEQPQLLSHEVYKPVVQDLREIIQPFRRITQEIKPVVEEVHTLVAKGERPVVEGAEVAQTLAQGQVISSSSSSSTTSQVSGLKTSQVVEQKTESVTDFK